MAPIFQPFFKGEGPQLIREIQWFEKDCEKPDCNPPDGGPHIHFKIVAETLDGRTLTNGVRLNGKATFEARMTAKSLLKEWLREQPLDG